MIGQKSERLSGRYRALAFALALPAAALSSLACGTSSSNNFPSTTSGGSDDGGGASEAGPAGDGGSSSGGTGVVDASFVTGTWLSGCDVLGADSAKYCTTFSGADGYASRTQFFPGNTTCSGSATPVVGMGTYALAGAASAPSDATKMDIVIVGFGPRFSILARDGANLKFGKEDATHDGSSEAQRYARFMVDAHVKGTCPF